MKKLWVYPNIVRFSILLRFPGSKMRKTKPFPYCVGDYPTIEEKDEGYTIELKGKIVVNTRKEVVRPEVYKRIWDASTKYIRDIINERNHFGGKITIYPTEIRIASNQEYLIKSVITITINHGRFHTGSGFDINLYDELSWEPAFYTKYVNEIMDRIYRARLAKRIGS